MEVRDWIIRGDLSWRLETVRCPFVEVRDWLVRLETGCTLTSPLCIPQGEQRRGGRVSNAPPGTVLDHTITSNSLYDFYLVSQHVSKGKS